MEGILHRTTDSCEEVCGTPHASLSALSASRSNFASPRIGATSASLPSGRSADRSDNFHQPTQGRRKGSSMLALARSKSYTCGELRGDTNNFRLKTDLLPVKKGYQCQTKRPHRANSNIFLSLRCAGQRANGRSRCTDERKTHRSFAGDPVTDVFILSHGWQGDVPGGARNTMRPSSPNEQATQLYQAGKFSEATPIAQEFLELSEKALGPDHPDTATALNNLAVLYRSMGDYAKAEPLYQRAVKIRRESARPRSPRYRHGPQQSGAAQD